MSGGRAPGRAMPQHGRGCAKAALCISVLTASTMAGAIAYGIYMADDMKNRMARHDGTVTQYKTFADHLSAQMHEMQRVDQTVSSRLAKLEAALAAIYQPSSAAVASNVESRGRRKREGMRYPMRTPCNT